MDALNPRNLRDCALGTIIGTFGFSYFAIFLLQFLLFHFPLSQGYIPCALAVIAFSVGIVLWYLCTVFHHVFSAFHDESTTEQQNGPWSGALFLVWTAALPTIVFLFPAQPLLQLGYTSAFTIIAVGNLPGSLFCDLHMEAYGGRFALHFASVVLLSLMPTIHALAEPVHAPSPLASAFGQMVMINVFGGAIYLLRPVERIGNGPELATQPPRNASSHDI